MSFSIFLGFQMLESASRANAVLTWFSKLAGCLVTIVDERAQPMKNYSLASTKIKLTSLARSHQTPDAGPRTLLRDDNMPYRQPQIDWTVVWPLGSTTMVHHKLVKITLLLLDKHIHGYLSSIVDRLYKNNVDGL